MAIVCESAEYEYTVEEQFPKCNEVMDQICANDENGNTMQEKCYNYTTTRCTVEKRNVTKSVPKISVSI